MANSLGFWAGAAPFVFWAFGLLALPENAMALGGNEAFEAHLALAVRNPADFGFVDSEEARQARLGWSYPYYSVVEWSSLARKPEGQADLAAAPPGRRLTEVLGSDGKPRCAFIQGRTAEAEWGPGILGFRNLRDELTLLGEHPRREHLVLLVDPETRLLRYADRDDPDRIQNMEPER